MGRDAGKLVGLIFALLVAGLRPGGMTAQSAAPPPPPRQSWKALWISHPTAPLREPIVLHFRHEISLPTVPGHFLVHVSADNRFVFYVNGQRVGEGPARGDLDHWRYESFDLAPYLHAGVNRLAATVWNFGIYAPLAQISDRTAFLLEGDTDAEAVANTGLDWRVAVEGGWVPLPRPKDGNWEYMAAGYGEVLDCRKFDWYWMDEPTDGGRWVAAGPALRENIYPNAGRGGSRGTGPNDTSWQLVPDTLPSMSYAAESAGDIVRVMQAGTAIWRRGDKGETAPELPRTIPAHTVERILLDRETLTTGYPELRFAGGAKSKITITYDEALYDQAGKKGDRNEVGDRVARGLHDEIYPDGGLGRRFEPLWWRTWRYAEILVETEDDAVTIEGFSAHFSAYPYKQLAQFHSSDPELNRIWQVGWHTVELVSHETFMDTPYWEQLQYVGDTRIEALVSKAVSGDDRLVKQALRAFDQSRRSDGIVASRYPASLEQNIPTFALLWIGMVHDAWRYEDDTPLIREMLPGVRTVLAWFSRYQDADGLLHKLPWWSFVDWVTTKQDFPGYDARGESCLTTLDYIGALDEAAELERNLGDTEASSSDQARSGRARAGVMSQCWNAELGLVADSPAKNTYSQHANILAALYDAGPDGKLLMQKVLAREMGDRDHQPAVELTESSYYFRFYLSRALEHVGLADEYVNTLKEWRGMLKMGFSTWPETPGDTRSDSHAWSAHPTYDLLALVAGIEPADAGFAHVKIEPHLDVLKELDATYPHASGLIHVHYGDGKAEITLPGSLTGRFVWKGQVTELKSGENVIELP